MATAVNTYAHSRNFAAGATITRGMLLVYNGTSVSPQSADAITSIGVAMADASSGEQVPVELWGPTKLILCDAAVAAGGILYTKAGGEVDDAGTTVTKLQAIGAGTANGLVECAMIQ